ncbi:MAG TPA: nucleoside diphosphate kinase regulator [Dongiaceae bacterium]|nr:nucleoside diphosphate kinase regulator [Dongiaceae bacterium]
MLPPIVVTRPDYERLSGLADAAMRHASTAGEKLAAELDRARIVEADEIAPDVVTMHARFSFRDEAHGTTRTVSLVYPGEENIDEGRISILTPMGAALLGLSEGQSITLEGRDGASRSLTILKLLSQPRDTAAEGTAAAEQRV